MRNALFLPFVILAACGSSSKPPVHDPQTPPPSNQTHTPSDPPPVAATGPDADAEALIKIILAPEPTIEPFQKLYALMSQVSAEEKARIVALGTDINAPIHVPDIGSEYEWAQAFDCGGAKEENVMQSLVSGPAGELDLLEFDCPDKSHHAIYYDFSADPTEKAMRQELGGGGKP
jgi:hypothetical protein